MNRINRAILIIVLIPLVAIVFSSCSSLQHRMQSGDTAATQGVGMQRSQAAIEKYKNTLGEFSIENDQEDGRNVVEIHTQRFLARTLYTDKTDYQDFPREIKELYTVTFGDNDVMQKYEHGVAYSKERFAKDVTMRSSRALHNYPFNGFIVTDKNSDAVVGFETIGNGGQEGAGEMVYLFNKKYHNNGYLSGNKHAGVGYENVGALVFGYGKQLYENGAFVNADMQTFVGGNRFEKITASARVDNPGSIRILEKLGFEKQGRPVELHGNQRFLFEFNYGTIA